MTHGRASSTYILGEEKSEEYPTSGNDSPVCWQLRWSRASLLPALLLLVRNSIYLSPVHFYAVCNLGEKGMGGGAIEIVGVLWGEQAVMGQSASVVEKKGCWEERR